LYFQQLPTEQYWLNCIKSTVETKDGDCTPGMPCGINELAADGWDPPRLVEPKLDCPDHERSPEG